MSNVFNTKNEIHKRFDIKGSMYMRTTPEDCDPTVARKDGDWVKSG